MNMYVHGEQDCKIKYHQYQHRPSRMFRLFRMDLTYKFCVRLPFKIFSLNNSYTLFKQQIFSLFWLIKL